LLVSVVCGSLASDRLRLFRLPYLFLVVGTLFLRRGFFFGGIDYYYYYYYYFDE
jgi:hypothetical protein